LSAYHKKQFGWRSKPLVMKPFVWNTRLNGNYEGTPRLNGVEYPNNGVISMRQTVNSAGDL